MTAQENLQVRVVKKQTEAEGIASYELARLDGAAQNQHHLGVGLEAHHGTGNYHAGNAKLYTDYSLLTSDDALLERLGQMCARTALESQSQARRDERLDRGQVHEASTGA